MLFGPYELRGELGRGAMAVVWRAWDPKLEREVAIKEPLLPAGASEQIVTEFSQRFIREARAAARLNHPGIVTVHAVDLFDGRPGIVMELIEGETLGSLLQRHRFDAASVVGILAQLLDALDLAHQHGVVHRDVKPDNVFLTTSATVKLTDFGVAHMDAGAQLTREGTVIGTPGYMSPEQVVGGVADARSDVFAAGVIGYELLTGRNPFGANEGLPSTTVMYRIVHEPPPPVDAAALQVSHPVLTVLAVSLRKEPSSRFANAREMRDALLAAWNGGTAEVPQSAAPRDRGGSDSNEEFAREMFSDAYGPASSTTAPTVISHALIDQEADDFGLELFSDAYEEPPDFWSTDEYWARKVQRGE